MRILERRQVPGLATLYLADSGRPERVMEFVDTLEPGVPRSEKWVMMISTQIGCPVGCLLCDAGTLGYRGNLTAEEMLEQVRQIAGDNPGLNPRSHPKVKIHFARMGEPALNPEVLKALIHLGRHSGWPGLVPSVSTVAPKSPAVEPFFEQLIAVKRDFFGGGRFQLQFSVHSTDEAQRRRLVPVRTWTLEEIAAYGERFVRPGDRKITLNFAAPPGAPLDAAVVERVFRPDRFLVKITPVNPTETSDRRGTSRLWNEAPEDVSRFAAGLESAGFRVIL